MLYGWCSVTVCIIRLLLVVPAIASVKIDKVCRGRQVVLGYRHIRGIVTTQHLSLSQAQTIGNIDWEHREHWEHREQALAALLNRSDQV